ncbi:hypothetical protein B0J17DRAFT_722812 [Rhizoctonia solani]|nr:hypothetical protein B0J17DRAFT_722812 [Rhizoctonia solani]
MFVQPVPHATPSWYQGSMSCVLHHLAQRAQGALAPEICSSLNEAAGRVFIHESYLNDLQAANPGRPISSDPLFVYNGYTSALSNMFRTLTVLRCEDTPRGQVCHNMHIRLQNILNEVHSRGNDVTGLFKDPNLGKALADFAGFLSAF